MKAHRLLGACGLVAGTSIGAAMLAQPITVGLGGFIPSLFALGIIWILLIASAFYLLEVEMQFPRGSNLMTMAKASLGPVGRFCLAIFYILLLYSLISAYLAGGTAMAHDVVERQLGSELPFWSTCLIFVVIFGAFIFLGVASVDQLNRLLMIGLIASYLYLCVASSFHIEPARALQMQPKYVWLAIPVIVTSFGFHIIIPTLSDYLNRSKKQLIKALWIGGSIPFAVYLIWNFLVIGMLPYSGHGSIMEAFRHGLMPYDILERATHSIKVVYASGVFGFFAIITSFLGVSASLLDFISDALKIKKSRIGRLILCMLVFIPPVVFVLTQMRGFYLALQYGGFFVCALLGVFPPLMAMALRRKNKKKPFKVLGGTLLAWGVCLLFVVLGMICLFEVYHQPNI